MSTMADDKDEEERKKLEAARRELDEEVREHRRTKPSLRVVPLNPEPWRSPNWLPSGENIAAEFKRMHVENYCDTEAEGMSWRAEK